MIMEVLFQQVNLSKKKDTIYKQMYLYEFYTKKTRQVLRGIDSSVDFVTLREGDTDDYPYK